MSDAGCCCPYRHEHERMPRDEWSLLATTYIKHDDLVDSLASPEKALPLQRLCLAEQKLMHHLTVMLADSNLTSQYAIMLPQMPM